MKNLKFRVWDKEEKQMLYRNIYDICDGCHADDFRIYVNDAEDRPEIMHFIGMTDKNGKEIYEGDIIESVGEMINIGTGKKTGKISKQRYEIIYNVECAQFTEKRLTDGWITRTGMPGQDIISKYYSVVGNIYEEKK